MPLRGAVGNLRASRVPAELLQQMLEELQAGGLEQLRTPWHTQMAFRWVQRLHSPAMPGFAVLRCWCDLFLALYVLQAAGLPARRGGAGGAH